MVKFRLPKLRKKKAITSRERKLLRKIKSQTIKKASLEQVSKSLRERRLRTAQRVLDSNASPVAKAKARRILGV